MQSERWRRSRRDSRRSLIAALAISVLFFAIEVIGGLLTNSLALLADAGHVLTDVGAIILALIAFRFAERPISAQRTFGSYRLESFAALANGLLLWAVAAWVALEAYNRLIAPPAVESLPMLLVATAGLVANVVSGLIIKRASQQSLNVRAAYLHIMTDALQSVGVVVAGLVMLATGNFLADPLVSMVIAVFIAISGTRVIREAARVLMESTPRSMDVTALCQRLEQVEGVEDVHDIHAWSITSGFEVLSCHVAVADRTPAARSTILAQLRDIAEREFQIEHVTIQMEESAEACPERHHVEHEPKGSLR